MPAYTLQELTLWMSMQPRFEDMFAAWVSSGYTIDLAPSVDRPDDAMPYSLSNIPLMTWAENRAKAGVSKMSNDLLVHHRAVLAYHQDGTLYKEYASMAEAMREFGGKPTASFGISSVCNGTPVKDGRGKPYTPRTYKGFTWSWKVPV